MRRITFTKSKISYLGLFGHQMEWFRLDGGADGRLRSPHIIKQTERPVMDGQNSLPMTREGGWLEGREGGREGYQI